MNDRMILLDNAARIALRDRDKAARKAIRRLIEEDRRAADQLARSMRIEVIDVPAKRKTPPRRGFDFAPLRSRRTERISIKARW